MSGDVLNARILRAVARRDGAGRGTDPGGSGLVHPERELSGTPGGLEPPTHEVTTHNYHHVKIEDTPPNYAKGPLKVRRADYI